MSVRAPLLLEIGGALQIEEVRLREPGPHEAIVRMTASAVCITDVLSSEGHVITAPPTLLGHAAAGVVEQLGAGVSGFAVGDRAAAA